MEAHQALAGDSHFRCALEYLAKQALPEMQKGDSDYLVDVIPPAKLVLST